MSILSRFLTLHDRAQQLSLQSAKGRIISALSPAASALLIADSYELSASRSMRTEGGERLDHALDALGSDIQMSDQT